MFINIAWVSAEDFSWKNFVSIESLVHGRIFLFTCVCVCEREREGDGSYVTGKKVKRYLE